MVVEKVPIWSVTGSVTGLIPGAVLLKVKLELECKGILVWSTAKGDLELSSEGEEGNARRDKDPRRPGGVVAAVLRPAHDGRVAVGGQRDGGSFVGESNSAGADQLLELGPRSAAAGVDPRRPDEPVVGRPAHDGGVAVGGQRDGEALLGGSTSDARTDQLAALLAPGSATAGVDPCRPCACVVAKPAHDGGVAVGGQRDGVALVIGAGSHGSVPTSLLPCWLQVTPLRVKTQAAPV